MQAGPEPMRTIAIASAAEAEQLLGGALAAMAALGEVLDEESAHLAAGRLRAGLATEARKGELAAGYLLALQSCKANAVALARFAPESLKGFRAAQVGFMGVVARNQAVIGTARAVSEGLVKEVASEMNRSRQVGGYSRPNLPAAGRPAPAAPLVFSGRF